MSQQIIRGIEEEYLNKNLPTLNPGDTVKATVRIKEGSKERLQAFEGVIISIKGSGISRTVKIRKIFQGIGVERTFLMHSPKIESFKVIRRGVVRRAKLYYMRGRSGKSARIREKIVSKSVTKAGKK